MKLSPSLMCAQYDSLKNEISQLEKAGADCFHLDVMDGVFVPNFAMGLEDIKCICRLSTIPTELHLMINHPSNYIELFANTGVDTIYIHPESDYHPTTAIQKIIEMGKKPGIVLNPGTSIESIIELLNIVSKVMIMGVNPGHAGQVYLPYVDKKIEKLVKIKDDYCIEITLDGACSLERIKEWYPRGVDGFVLGTAALFGKQESYSYTIRNIRESVGG